MDVSLDGALLRCMHACCSVQKVYKHACCSTLFGQPGDALCGVPHPARHLHRVRGRADERHACALEQLHKLGVFRKEAVAGVHCLRLGAVYCLQHGITAEVALQRRGGALKFGICRMASGEKGRGHHLSPCISLNSECHRVDAQWNQY